MTPFKFLSDYHVLGTGDTSVNKTDKLYQSYILRIKNKNIVVLGNRCNGEK